MQHHDVFPIVFYVHVRLLLPHCEGAAFLEEAELAILGGFDSYSFKMWLKVLVQID